MNTHFPHITFDDVYRYLVNNFTIKEMDELNFLSITLEKENCLALAECLSETDLEFLFLSLEKDMNSKPFYEVMYEDEEWTDTDKIEILIEKNTFYINSNSCEVQLLLELIKGADYESVLSQEEMMDSYTGFLTHVCSDYTDEELKKYRFIENLPSFML